MQSKKNNKNIPKSKILFDLTYAVIIMHAIAIIGIDNIINQKEINSIRLRFSAFFEK